MLASFKNLSRAGKFQSELEIACSPLFSRTGVPRLIATRSVFFRDKKSELHPPEPFKSAVPPHLEKQQQKALSEYKANEDPSLQCYGKRLSRPKCSHVDVRVIV